MSKRLLFISPIFPKDATEDHVVPFITQFTHNFAKQTDVTIDVISLMYPFTNQDYKAGLINVYPIGSGFKRTFRILPYLVKAIFKGIRLNQKYKYDGVLCFWYREASLVGKFISLFSNGNQKVWMLGQDINKDNKYIPLLKIKESNLIMMSAQQRDFFFTHHGIHIDKIANVAIDRSRFPELNSGKRTIHILGVGNLGLLKNYTLFLDIVKDVISDFPNLNAVICGDDGGEKENLLNKVTLLQLNDNVEFSGEVSQKKVLEYMNDAIVFLHTSKSEGGGTVLQEALYSGCHVVSTIDIENSVDTKSFFYSTNKDLLVAQIKSILSQNPAAERVEKFKMEDTVQTIYNAFY